MEYEYRPLESKTWVRVLYLQPAESHEDRLEGRIGHLDRQTVNLVPDSAWSDSDDEDLNDVNSYEAVSYTWGEPVFTEKLIVLPKTSSPENGSSTKSSETYLAITPNVNTMLRYFRSSTAVVHLWLDAICLNQADTQEMGQQIALMGEIYARAIRTRIWLGPEEHGVENIFRFLRTYDIKTVDEMRRSLLAVFNSSSIEPLMKFFERPWFGRRWWFSTYSFARSFRLRVVQGVKRVRVVSCNGTRRYLLLLPLILADNCSANKSRVAQELALSNDAVFYAGFISEEYRNLQDGFSNAVDMILMVDVDGADYSYRKAHSGIIMMTSISVGRSTLLERLYMNDMLQCRDPRDYLLAFHGITSDDPFWAAQVERTGSSSWMYQLTWQELFKSFSRFYFQNASADCGFTILLAALGTLAELDENEASWCPNLHKPRKPGTLMWRMCCDPEEPAYFKAYSSNQDIGNTFDDSGDRLLMRQHAMKLRTQISPMTEEDMSDWDPVAAIENLLQLAPFVSVPNLLSALFDLVGTNESTTDLDRSVDHVAMTAWMGDWFSFDYDTDKGRDSVVTEGLTKAFYDVFTVALASYSLFVTEPYLERASDDQAQRRYYAIGLCKRSLNRRPITSDDLVLVSGHIVDPEMSIVQQIYIRPLTESEQSKFSGELSTKEIERQQSVGWAWSNESASVGRMAGSVSLCYFECDEVGDDTLVEVPKYNFIVV